MIGIAIFIAGVATGITLYKSFIFYILGRFPHTICDYCSFVIKKDVIISAKEK